MAALRILPSKLLVVLLSFSLIFAGCNEPAGSSESISEHSTAAPLSSAPSAPKREETEVKVNDDITVRFLQNGLPLGFPDVDALTAYVRLQIVEENIYYLSTEGQASSIVCKSMDDFSVQCTVELDKRISDFVILENEIIVANVIRPTDELDVPEPEYPLGMYIYSLADGTFQSAADYFTMDGLSADFCAYSGGMLYFTAGSRDNEALYAADGNRAEMVMENCPGQWGIWGKSILYLKDNTLYLHAEQPLPILRVESESKNLNFAISDSSVVLWVENPLHAKEDDYIVLDMVSQKVLGHQLLFSEYPKRVTADGVQMMIERWETVGGGSTRVLESHMEVFSWGGSMAASYPVFDNPPSVYIGGTVIHEEVLYYVDFSQSPAELKSLLPIR